MTLGMMCDIKNICHKLRVEETRGAVKLLFFQRQSLARLEAIVENLDDYREPEPRWKPIETAKTDGTEYIVLASPKHGLPGFVTKCAYHEDAGWCVDELRDVTHWLCECPPTPQDEPL